MIIPTIWLSVVLETVYSVNIETWQSNINGNGIKWSNINKDFIEGKRSIYDESDFTKNIGSGEFICNGIGHVYRVSTLDAFVESVLVETAQGTDHFCLIKSQRLLTFVDSPPRKLEVDLGKVDWSNLKGHQLSAVLGICRNMNLPCLERLQVPESEVDQVKYRMFKHPKLTGLEKKETIDEKIDLKTLAIMVGDGTITNETDLEGNPLEGADMDDMASHLVSVLTTIKMKYLTEGAPFNEVIDIKLVDRMIEKLKDAGILSELLRVLAPKPDGYEVFEDVVLDLIKQLDIGEDILLMTSVTEHAVNLSIKRTGPKMVEVLLFNSGYGLENHSSVQIGEKEKHFPASRYVNIPIGILKSLGVIKKLAELTAIVRKFADPIDERATHKYTSEDLYQCALAPLNDYSYQFTVDDISTYRVISAQRSGTCSHEFFWAYFAFNLGESFRPLKLLSTKEVIDRSLGHEWTELEKPVYRRLLKFGMENYARSLLKYRKREMKTKNLNMNLFGDRKFWSAYQGLRIQLGPKKPIHFKTGELNSERWSGFAKDLKDDSISALFKANEAMESKMELLVGENDHSHELPSNSPKDLKELNDQIVDILYIISKNSVWNLASNTDKLVVLTSYINDMLPTPTPEKDFWDSVLVGSVVDEPILKLLFDLLFKLAVSVNLEQSVCGSTYISFLKMLAIFHKAMTVLEPEFRTCAPIVLDLRIINVNAHHFIDTTLLDEYHKLETFIGSVGTRPCEVSFSQVEAYEKSPLGLHLSKYVNLVTLGGFTLHSLKLLTLHAERVSDHIPPHHYFWRDALNYFKAIKGFDSVPSGGGIENGYNPYTSCYVVIDYMHCGTTQYTPISQTDGLQSPRLAYQPSMNFGMPGFAYPPVGNFQKSFSDLVDSAKKDFDLGDRDLPLYFNYLFGDSGGIERLGTLLMNDHASFDWRTYLILGTASVAQILPNKVDAINISPELCRRVFDLYDEDVQRKIRLIRSNRLKIVESKKTDLLMTSTIRKCSAQLILEAQIVVKVSNDSEMKTIFAKTRSDFLGAFDLVRTNPEYFAYLAFAYILSYQALEMTLDAAKTVVRLNQKLAANLNVLSNENDLNSYLFELRRIVYRATQVLKRTRSKGSFIDALYEEVTEGSEVKIVLPFVEIDGTKHINLMSGQTYVNGILMVGPRTNEIDTIFKKCDYDPENLKFISSKMQIKRDQKMMSLEVNPLTTRTLVKRNGKQISLVRVKILETVRKTMLLEEFNDGSIHYYLTILREDWKGISLPATNDSSKPYSIYQVPVAENTTEFVFLHEDTCIWVSDDRTFNFDGSLVNLVPVQLSTQDLLSNPLAEAEAMSLFRMGNDGDHLILFRYYSDHSGRPMWLRQDPETLIWNLFFDGKYSVSENQQFTKSEYLQNFLVIENSGLKVRKVLIPIEFYAVPETKFRNFDDDPIQLSGYRSASSVNDNQSAGLKNSTLKNKKKGGYQMAFDRENMDVLKATVMISLSSDGYLKPASRFEHLILSYKFLIAREYLDSFNQLLMVHQIGPFSPAELRLFGWITTSFSANRDGSPESVAIRAYSAYLVFANDQLFGVFKESKSEEEEEKEKEEHDSENTDPSKAPGPYDSEEKWMKFWTKNITGRPCIEVANAYINIRSNLPISLRFDFRSGRELLTQYEETFWLESLYQSRKGGSSSSENIRRFLKQEDSNPQYSVSVEQTIPASIDSNVFDYTNSFSTGEMELKMSYFHPEEFERRVYKLFNYFMFGKYSEYEAEVYWERLESLKNTKFAYLAGQLLSSLLVRRWGKTPQSCIDLAKIGSTKPNYDSTYWKEECTKLYELCFSSCTGMVTLTPNYLKRSVLTMAKPTSSIKKEKLLPEGKLNTSIIEFSPIGKFKNLNEFKDSLLKKEIDSEASRKLLSETITKKKEELASLVLKIQSSVNNAWENESKTPLEVEIRRIGKGTRTIDEKDILHLYMHASKSRYYQYYPEVPEEEYQSIHDLCTAYAVNLADLNDMNRLLVALDGDDGTWHLEVKKRRCRTRSDDNVMLAYEIFINSRLTKRQFEDIKELATKLGTNFTNKVIQRMMSAGKTFILGTILSILKADRSSLSVLVVPRALYSSEASSLISRTFNAFGSAGFSFRVTRESSSISVMRLKWLGEAMETARLKGKYIIVAPETLLTLQNRFTEIVLKNNAEKQDQQEFLYLQKILKILHDYGAATFDEIDMIFDPTQELNFPLSWTMEDSGQEFSMLGTVVSELYLTLLDEDVVAMADIRKNIVIAPEVYKEIRLMLIDKMTAKLSGEEKFVLPFNHTNESLLKFETSELEAELKEFFTVSSDYNDREQVLERHAGIILNELSQDDFTRSVLSTLRLLINEWVLASWSGNVNENYGISSKQPYAIPYASAGVAKEGSEFSFRWFTYVRTERMYLTLGLDRERLIMACNWLQDWASEEIDKNILPENSLPFQLSKQLFEDEPSAIDTNSIEEMDLYLEKLKGKQETQSYKIFLLLWIGQRVIPSVSFYDQQISANSQDFSMIFASIQGYTGTIATVKILPPVFHPKDVIQLQQKIEDQIESRIRGDKVYEVIEMVEGWEILRVPVGLNSEELWKLKQIQQAFTSMENAGHPLNAIIDVGAYFKDESNEQVAESLSKLKPAVLYFSSKLNKLAVKIGSDKEKMIETISRASLEDLGINPADRITLYDQQHCTGVDIFQHDKGFAFVILGFKTTTRDFNQAIMRMRKYIDGQKIVISAPDNVAEAISSKKDTITIDDVLEFLHKNMKEKVKMQNSLAMGHILRTHHKRPVYEKLLSQPLKDLSCCKSGGIWVKSTEAPLEQQILPLKSEKFIDFKTREIADYGSIIKECIGEEAAKATQTSAKAILEGALRDSPEDYSEEVKISAVEDNDQMVENEVEALREIDLENEIENQPSLPPLMTEAETLDFNLKKFPDFHEFRDNVEKRFMFGPPGSNRHEIPRWNKAFLINLQTYLKNDMGVWILNGFFSSQIYVSTAFLKHIFGRNRSYPFYILWLQGKYGLPKAALINSSEAKEVKQKLAEKGKVFGCHGWLLTSTGVQCQLRDTAPDIDLEVIANVLIFGGLNGILERPEWSPYFVEWLSSTGQSSLRSTVYRTIIMDASEGRKALKGPLGKYLEVDEDEENQLMASSEYQTLNTLSGNTKTLKKYIDGLLKATDPESFDSAQKFANFTEMNKMDSFKQDRKDILRKGIDLLVENAVLEKVTFEEVCGWDNFESLARRLMDEEDLSYTVKKIHGIIPVVDFKKMDTSIAWVLVSLLNRGIEKLDGYTPELTEMIRDLKSNFLKEYLIFTGAKEENFSNFY